MAAETIKFKIEDQEYEVPEVDDLDLDEWQVIYEYSGLLLDDFAPLAERDKDGNVTGGDEEADDARLRRLSQPAFTTAMLHISYQRAHPKTKAAEVKALVSGAKMLHILEAMAENADEGDVDPPASTTGPEQSLQSEPVVDNGSMSSLSGTSLAPPEDKPVPIGTTG